MSGTVQDPREAQEKPFLVLSQIHKPSTTDAQARDPRQPKGNSHVVTKNVAHCFETMTLNSFSLDIHSALVGITHYKNKRLSQSYQHFSPKSGQCEPTQHFCTKQTKVPFLWANGPT